ncbi:hypothetical protein AMECASPLE_008651 [Ameca splendens]|uniref:Uncharacterized protein n=1 Tax=Ameca splendens TaxID=208324 RepID=A0ABV1A7Z4_9TELE
MISGPLLGLVRTNVWTGNRTGVRLLSELVSGLVSGVISRLVPGGCGAGFGTGQDDTTHLDIEVFHVQKQLCLSVLYILLLLLTSGPVHCLLKYRNYKKIFSH